MMQAAMLGPRGETDPQPKDYWRILALSGARFQAAFAKRRNFLAEKVNAPR
jgi:hypothetical protein